MNAFRSLRPRSKLTPQTALVASVVFHGAVIAVSAVCLARMGLPSPRASGTTPTIEVALTDAIPAGVPERLRGEAGLAVATPLTGRAREPVPHAEEPPHERSSGALREPRPDTRTSGRGGSRESSEKALHLSDSIDGLTLDTDPTFLTRESQLSRLETSEDRRSREDRRATPNPMELTFVASGSGSRLARLTPADTDPSEGAFGSVPVRAGAPATPDPVPAPEPADGRRTMSAKTDVGAVPVAAQGVDHGSAREDYRRSAAVALARPSVRQGRASIATASHGMPRDTVDSSQEVASLVQSLITASSAGGPEGRGPGGAAGDGAPGSSGASGPGSRARPSGEGGAEDPSSALGIRSYAAALTRKVYPYWEDALPLWARAEGRGGMAVIGVTIGENGNVRDVHLVRGSGIPEFDAKVASALERASPYGPLPRAIRSEGLVLNIAFDAMNPAVGRAGPGPGRR